MKPQGGRFRRSSRTGLDRLRHPSHHPALGSTSLTSELRGELVALRADLEDLGPADAEVTLDLLRHEKEHALEQAAIFAVRSGFRAPEVAEATGLDPDWLVQQLG